MIIVRESIGTCSSGLWHVLCAARMLPSGFSWATFASLVLGVSCANDFVTNNASSRSFPLEFGAGMRTTIYWTNLTGFIAGIYVDGPGQSDDSAEYTWVVGQLTHRLNFLTPSSPSYSHMTSTKSRRLTYDLS